MKKQLFAFAACVAILGSRATGLSEAKAAHQTVSKWNASWTYGSEIVLTGRRGYSNLGSSVRWHSSSVSIGEGSAFSGNTQPGAESKASRIAGYTASANYYYNIW